MHNLSIRKFQLMINLTHDKKLNLNTPITFLNLNMKMQFKMKLKRILMISQMNHLELKAIEIVFLQKLFLIINYTL